MARHVAAMTEWMIWDSVMTAELEIFPWNENFATGIEAIDIQHKRLVELLNILVGHMAFQLEAPAVEQIMDELANYTQVHFRDEELIWDEYFRDDPWERWHKDAHADFIGKIVELRASSSGKSAEQVIEEIVSFLTHWLALHIIESDKRMAKVVLALPSGVSLQQAKETANAEMEGATRLLINTVMGMYDSLALRTIQLTREINARIKTEAALRQAQEELLRLKNMAEQGEQRTLREIGNFAYVLSHHLQEPVRQQLIFTSKLKKLMGDVPDHEPEVKSALDEVCNGGERLRTLIRDMQVHLALSDKPWQPRLCDTTEVLDEAVIRLSARIREKGAVLTWRDLPAAWVDPRRLADVFVALIDNALHFCPAGTAPVINVGAVEEADGLRVFVEDAGPGIPEDLRERAFNIFERLDPECHPTGTGIGLSIVRKIAEAAGGRAWIETSPLGGIRVQVRLPQLAAPAAVSAA